MPHEPRPNGWVAASVIAATLSLLSCRDDVAVGVDPAANEAVATRAATAAQAASTPRSSGPVSQREEGQREEAGAVAERVQQYLVRRLGPPARDIEVFAEEGIVVLEGRVVSSYHEARAAELVAAVEGVRAIANRLEHVPDEADDGAIVRDVQTALAAEPATEVWDIEVSSAAGVVGLTGTVDSETERSLAAIAAQRVPAVRGVVNALEVEPVASRSDEEIEVDAERALALDPFLDASDVSVTVRQGQVTLTGSVDREEARARARALADVAGAKSVDPRDLAIVARSGPALRDGPWAPGAEDVVEAAALALERDPRIPHQELTLSYGGGKLTLSGTVANLEEKRGAVTAAASALGVLVVDDELELRPTERAPTAEEIATALRDAGVEGEYRAMVAGREVELRGLVDSQYHRALGEEIVSELPGVAAVDNALAVRAPSVLARSADFGREPGSLAEAVREGLEQAPGLADEKILVLVGEEDVTLTGAVDDPAAARRAIEAAYAAGATTVRSKLVMTE